MDTSDVLMRRVAMRGWRAAGMRWSAFIADVGLNGASSGLVPGEFKVGERIVAAKARSYPNYRDPTAGTQRGGDL